MTAWVEIGLDPAVFWTLTPKMARAITEGRLKALEREQYNRAWHAHQAASLNAFAYHDPHRMPSLASVTGTESKIKKQTPAEMRAVFAAMREGSAQ